MHHPSQHIHPETKVHDIRLGESHNQEQGGYLPLLKIAQEAHRKTNLRINLAKQNVIKIGKTTHTPKRPYLKIKIIQLTCPINDKKPQKEQSKHEIR